MIKTCPGLDPGSPNLHMGTRRDFLKQSALAAAGIILAENSFGNFHIAKKPVVIIIGAGFAGLAAAYQLRKQNIDVVVLESRKRVGGRVYSYPIDPKENLIVELGAEWVGYSHTRIHELCSEFSISLENNQFDTHLIYKGEYTKKKKTHFSDDWHSKFEQLKTAFKTMPEDDQEKFDQLDWWRYLVNNGCNGRDLDLHELMDSTDFGESIRHVSAYAAMAEYAESSDKNEMDEKMKGGNSQLAFKLADKIGKGNILLDHRVNRIEQDPNGGVKVHCSNGKLFSGDKIICTVPTFAAMQIKWEPGLPELQLSAMNQLQYARINKNPLVFNKRFWKDESFDMITDQTPHYFYHATKNQKSAKGVLISYTIGEKAAVIANQSKEWKAATIQQTLSPYFGNIKSMLVDQANYYWGNDEFSRGAYALYGVGQWFGLRETLQASHIHTHFAGEHLAEWQGFMEGAINTGEEAAAKI